MVSQLRTDPGREERDSLILRLLQVLHRIEVLALDFLYKL